MPKFKPIEIRPISGWPGYYVSSNGQMISGVSGKVIFLSPTKAKGYLRVCLQDSGRKRSSGVHALVLTAFRGPCPPGKQAAHLNGIRDDNRLENLKWVTAKENTAHKKIHGTNMEGERHWVAKLTNKKVKEARALYLSGMTMKELSQKFGICKNSITSAVRGVTWGHIPGAVPFSIKYRPWELQRKAKLAALIADGGGNDG